MNEYMYIHTTSCVCVNVWIAFTAKISFLGTSSYVFPVCPEKHVLGSILDLFRILRRRMRASLEARKEPKK